MIAGRQQEKRPAGKSEVNIGANVANEGIFYFAHRARRGNVLQVGPQIQPAGQVRIVTDICNVKREWRP